MRVMIVEDDGIVAMSMREALMDAGHAVVGVSGHAKAAVRDATGGADLALVDVGLNGPGDGVELARSLLDDHRIRTLFVTGDPAGVAVARGWALGCLAKPCADAALVAAVEALGRVLRGEPPGPLPPGLVLFRERDAARDSTPQVVQGAGGEPPPSCDGDRVLFGPPGPAASRMDPP